MKPFDASAPLKADIAIETLDSLHEGCQVISRDYRYLYVNPSIVNQAKKSAEQLLGKTMMEVFPGIEQTEMFSLLQRCMNDSTCAQMQNRFLFEDGSSGWFELRFQPIPQGVVILSLDITQRKMAEQVALAQHRALLVLSECHRILIEAQSIQLFLKDFCNVTTKCAGYELVWVSLHQGPSSTQFRSHVGLQAEDSKIDSLIQLFESVPNVPPQTAVHSSEPVLLAEQSKWPNADLLRGAINEVGLQTALSVPFFADDINFGVVHFLSDDPDCFCREERALLVEVAHVLGHGINLLRHRDKIATATRQIHETTAKLHAVFESVTDGMFFTDHEGTILDFNEEFAHFHGFRSKLECTEQLLALRDSLELRTLDGLEIPPTQWPFFRALQGEISRSDYVIRRKDTGRRWTGTYSFGPIRAPDGEIIGAVGLCRDVTDQKKIEEQLRLLNANLEERVTQRTQELSTSVLQLQTVLDTTSEGICGIDPKGRILFINAAALQILRYDRVEEVLHRSYAEVLLSGPSVNDVGSGEIAIPVIARVLMGDDSVSVSRETFLTKDKTEIPVEIHIRAKRVSVDNRGCVVTFRDISEQLKNETILRKNTIAAESANQAKSAFLSNMSHEIRTPLNAILGYAQLLLRERTQTPPQRAYVESILRNGDHLLHLLGDILDIARIEAGKVELHNTTFSLQRMLTEIVGTFSIIASAKNLRLLLDVDENVPPFLVGDQDKLRQVFQNILNNSIKFTHSGGIGIRVRAQRVGPRTVQLFSEIEDTGCGIEEGEIQFLFKNFYQTNQGKQISGGTGLGLALCRHFVQLMGGDISAKSIINKGSTFAFKVTLGVGDPVSIRDVGVIPSVKGLTHGQKKYRVLVADDRDDNREVLSKLLASVGFEVELAVNGAHALELFQDNQTDLILMDMRMPVLNGIEAIKKIRAHTRGKEVKIIAVSASTFESDRKQAHEAGADDFMGKPFRDSELLQRIQRCLSVQYDYWDESPPPSSQFSLSNSDKGVDENVRALPKETIAALTHAAEIADVDLLVDEITKLRPAFPKLASELLSMATRYDYTSLTQLLTSTRSQT